VISHEEAVRTLATEKYLLGELYPELRDQFEEHLFDCQQCAFDLWAAATFLACANVILSRQA
jgi:anti-sigma factor RsiW